MPAQTLSIAAPASYWYLRVFPIKEIGEVVDYIIYMTYDLHGQWDHGNKWTTPGCPEGNCLRSHVNITETTNFLAMIIKAGVPAKKIFAGISSYGRSFHVSQAGCTDSMCQYTGSSTESRDHALIPMDTLLLLKFETSSIKARWGSAMSARITTEHLTRILSSTTM